MAGGETAAPLLEKKAAVYHEGCPGCAVEQRKALNPGVPYMEFFHIWIIILVSSMYLATSCLCTISPSGCSLRSGDVKQSILSCLALCFLKAAGQFQLSVAKLVRSFSFFIVCSVNS
jgi:hypothetical protein